MLIATSRLTIGDGMRQRVVHEGRHVNPPQQRPPVPENKRASLEGSRRKHVRHTASTRRGGHYTITRKQCRGRPLRQDQRSFLKLII